MDRNRYLPIVLLATFLIIGNFNLARAQNTGKIPVGVEVQVYPTGSIINASAGILTMGEVHVFNIRAAYNFVDRGNAGLHDVEEGGGPGIGLEYRYRSQTFMKGLFVGLRSDFWWLNLDWENRLLFGNQLTQGTTDVTVWQPTLQLGYDLLIDDPGWHLTPSLSFGYEVNIKTDGEPVGEGMILLGGFRLTRYL